MSISKALTKKMEMAEKMYKQTSKGKGESPKYAMHGKEKGKLSMKYSMHGKNSGREGGQKYPQSNEKGKFEGGYEMADSKGAIKGGYKMG